MEAAQAEKQSKAFRIASLVALGVATMTLLLPAYALIYIGPVFGEMFKDFQTALPVSTSLLLSIPPTAYIVFFALLILGIIVKEVMIRNKRVTFVVNAAIIVSIFPFLFFFMWIMYLPIHRAAG
jgi:type II secretory pathway component PulF